MRFGRGIVHVAMLSAALLVVGRVRAQSPAPQVVCVTGVIDGTLADGTPTQAVLDILLAVPAGQDEQTATAAALKAAGARAPGPGDIPLVRQPFVLDGLSWPQFFDKSKLNNVVPQFYDPTGDPTGGQALTPILNAEATWSAVRGSSFRYAYGGQGSTGPPYLDGDTTISWSSNPLLGGDGVGVTITTFRRDTFAILDTDIQLNTNFPWYVDGRDLDVQTVLLHEMGHALGLGHSPDPSSIMYKFYLGVRRTLDVIDSDAVAFLYPAHTSNGATPRSASTPFRLVAALGDLAPGGGFFQQNVEFEVGDLNARGDASFASEVGLSESFSTGEGLFVASTHGTSQLERSLLPAPGGGVFDAGVAGRVTLNEVGDAAFASLLAPFQLPLGTNGGVYRWASSPQQLSAVVVPGLTSAPSGGVFKGAFNAAIAQDGSIVFGGIIDTTAGISGSLGMGVFQAARSGAISMVAAPGTAAPGSGVFNWAGNPSIGGSGDIGFKGHLSGLPCRSGNPQGVFISCDGNAYVKRHAGGIERIAGVGDPAPGGGVLISARTPLVNSRGDVVFAGDLTAPPRRARNIGLFLSSGGSLTAVVRPGDALPGGGHLVTTNVQSGQFSLNDLGEVAFAATLDTDNGAGIRDTGIYVRTAAGDLQLIARTDTVVPGLGTIADINAPAFVGSRLPYGGAVLNSRGDVLFTATLTDGLGVLLVAQR